METHHQLIYLLYAQVIKSLFQWSRTTKKQSKTYKFTFPITLPNYMAALFGMDVDDSSGNPDALSYKAFDLSYANIINNSSINVGLSVLVLGW